MTQALYLNAVGITCALGHSKEAVLDNLLAGSQSGIQQRADLLLNGPVAVGAVDDAALPALELDTGLERFHCRNNQLLLAAYAQIASTVDALIERYGRGRIAVVLGSSTSGIAEAESAMAHQMEHNEFPEGFHYHMQEIGSVADFLARYLDLQGLAVTVSTACSSSAKVFASARNLIEAGICDAALVGGVDSLCRLTLNGFSALESVSADITNPMSKNRDGITIGEGGALFVMSRDPGPVALLGVGESSDAYHMSAPHPEGVGAESAMREALRDAGVKPEEVGYINMHGTGTPKNDAMESLAIERVFGDAVPVSSTKGLTGHTLGAAGAIEVALCWLLLSSENTLRQLPPHRWDAEIDPELPALALVQGVEQPLEKNIILSNSFAFGGSNACVLLGAV